MSDLKRSLGTPKALAPSRAVAHRAVQFLTAAARANLRAAPDDSHSNLEWSPEKQAFLTHPMPVGQGHCQVGLSPASMILVFVCSDGPSRQLDLPGRSCAEAMAWLDEQLEDEGMLPASVAKIPYALPEDVAQIDVFPSMSGLRLDALMGWYSLAVRTITPLARGLADVRPGPSQIRCWPHHFDIATYVALEEGDAETARGIGVGLSPGDQSYDQPYFYMYPWPQHKSGALSGAIEPGHWHRNGFAGAVATGDELLAQPDICTGTQQFLQRAFDIGRTALKVS
ncbi:hypothetical protein [uncultured Tateyamaria sp.]|uniref:hypothetical protein n=1 Tax=uncultured Tateyamaria sp. TaxID=455651 RepID=UPI0026211A45|nr:hypothetical protein [uncultured Tateyamaria sp.]